MPAREQKNLELEGEVKKKMLAPKMASKEGISEVCSACFGAQCCSGII